LRGRRPWSGVICIMHNYAARRDDLGAARLAGPALRTDGLPRLARATGGPGLSWLRGPLGVVGRRSRQVLVERLDLRAGDRGPWLGPAPRSRGDARGGMVPGRTPELRPTSASPRRIGPGADLRRGIRRAGRVVLGAPAPGLRRAGPDAYRARRRTRRPGRGLPDERGACRRGTDRLREHRRDLVRLRARLRGRRGGCAVRAAAPEGPDRDRRLPLGRAHLSTP